MTPKPKRDRLKTSWSSQTMQKNGQGTGKLARFVLRKPNHDSPQLDEKVDGNLSSVEQIKKISPRINLRGLISFGRSYGSVLHALVPGRMSDFKVLFSRHELRSYGSVLHALVPGRMSDGLAKLIGRMDIRSYGSVLHALVPGRMSVGRARLIGYMGTHYYRSVLHAFRDLPGRMSFVSSIIAVLVVIGLVASFNQTQPLNAAASDELNFQARLLNDSGGVVPDGDYHAEFKLYDSAAAGASAQGVCVGGGTDDCLWVETHTGANTVRVVNGYLTVQLGSITGFPAIDWGEELWLSINIGGTSGPTWDGEMSPRMKVSAVPFAFDSERLDGLDSTDFVQIDQGEQAVNSASTLIAIDQAGAGGLIDLQVSNTTVFSVGNSGNVLATGGLQIPAFAGNEIYFSGGNLGNISSDGGLELRVDADNNSVSTLIVRNGTADAIVTINESAGLQVGDSDLAGTFILSDGTTHIGTIQTAALGSNRIYTLPDATGTVLLDTTLAATAFIQGGNTFGATAQLGTTDAQSLQFIVGGVDALTIADEGAVIFQNETDSTTALQVLDADGGTPVLNVDTTNERVGIGTATPDNALEIEGVGSRIHVDSSSFAYLILDSASSSDDNFLLFQHAGADQWYFGIDNGGGSSGDLSIKESNNGTPYLTVQQSTGNIGLNESAPITQLDVGGSTRITGSGTSVLTGSIDPDGTTSVTGVGTLFTTELVVGDRITVSGETRTVTAITSATSLTVDSVFSDNANDVSPDRLPALLSVTDASNNVDFVISDQGYVGIGDVSPSALLDINNNTFVVTENGRIGTGVNGLTLDGINAKFIIRGINSGQRGIDIQGGASQTGDYIMISDSSGNDLFALQADGDLVLGDTSAAANLRISDGSSNFGTLQTAALGSDRTYTLPDEDGTICLQGSSNCGFATEAYVTLQNAYNNGNIITTTDASDIDFLLDDTATDSNFDIDIVGGNTVTISRLNNAVTDAPPQLLLIENLDTNITIADALLITSANGLTDAIDVSDNDFVNAINVGSNVIFGGNATIDFNNFDVQSTGNIVLGGTSSPDITLQADGGATFNQQGADVDFTIGSDTNPYALFLQGSDGHLGLGTNAPSADLTFADDENKTINVLGRITNAAGRSLTVQAGNAGTGASAFGGGTLSLQGGNAAGTGNANGGNVVLTGGSGVGTGTQGLVVVENVAVNNVVNATCAIDCTIAQANVDTYTNIIVEATATDVEIIVPSPSITTAGRLLYITAADNTNEFTLTLNDGGANEVNIGLRENETATLIWNGSDWTGAGASSSTTLQSAYNNTLTSAGGAEIVLSGPGGSADGLTIRNNATTPISGGILEVQTSIGTNLFSVNNLGTELAANGGAEESTGFSTNWSAAPAGGTVTRTTTTGEYVTGQAGVDIVTGAVANHGVRNNLSGNPVVSTTYQVSFTARLDTGTFTTLDVAYSRDGGTDLEQCTNYSTQTLDTAGWTKITCTITTDGTGATNPDLIIRQTDATARTFWIDNLSLQRNDSTTEPSHVQIGGGISGGSITLFTLDRSSAPPVADGNDIYLGSMYYDTTSGRIQCYESDGWGACGSPPNNIITLTPEYAGSVLNGTGVGTMVADFCADESGVLQINDTLCASGEAVNYYEWTSPQASFQTYSIYLTFQLPDTFRTFIDDNTISLDAYTTDTADADVDYEIFRSTGSTITECGSDTTVTTSNNVWQSVTHNGNEASTCGFAGGDRVIFKLNLTARNNDTVYVSDINFTYTNE